MEENEKIKGKEAERPENAQAESASASAASANADAKATDGPAAAAGANADARSETNADGAAAGADTVATQTAAKKPSRGRSVGKYVALGIAVVILAALILNAVLAMFMPHYYPTFGKYRLFSIVSDSMEPEIMTGNMIVSEVPKSEDDIKVGDVITYEVADNKGNITLITHRVVAIEKNPNSGKTSYTTKGDNAPSNDSIHPDFDEVVGVFTGKQSPFFGYLIGFLQSSEGALMLITIIFIVIVTWLVTYYIDTREYRRGYEQAALKRSEQELLSVNLRHDNIREITAVIDVLDMITTVPENRKEEKDIEARLTSFINAETIELPQTVETAAILDALPAPDTPQSLASALRSGATLRQAEDGKTLVLTGMSGEKSILLTPIQTADGIILCQQGVRLRINVGPNVEDVGASSMPGFPEFFVGQPIKKNVEYPELPQPDGKELTAEELLGTDGRTAGTAAVVDQAKLTSPQPVGGQAKIASADQLKELSAGRMPTAEQLDPDGYRAKVAYAQYRELAAQLELRQVEQLQTLLDEVKPLTDEEQQLVDKLNAEEKAKKKAEPKQPRKEKTPEEKAAAKARAEKRKAEQEAFINALSPADRELYLSEQKLSKSRAATIRRLKKIARDRKRLEKMK